MADRPQRTDTDRIVWLASHDVDVRDFATNSSFGWMKGHPVEEIRKMIDAEMMREVERAKR